MNEFDLSGNAAGTILNNMVSEVVTGETVEVELVFYFSDLFFFVFIMVRWSPQMRPKNDD